MISFLRHKIRTGCARGQVVITFVLFLVVLILFVGLGIDVGFAYVTKANLSKAVDAAALVGVRNLMDNQVVAITQSAFAMNYGRPGRDTATVTPTVTVITDPTTNTRRLQVSASATINTFFLRLLPMWKTLRVTAEAETMRGRAILAVILDRSGSMVGNGGWSALPPGVDTFIDLFDDNIDRAALTTYSSAARLDLSMRQPFRSQIKAAVPRQQSQYAGATFMTGGLAIGFTQITNTPVQTGENVTRAAIFFTDGLVNVAQDLLPWCVTPTLINFGGTDSTAVSTVGFFNSTTGVCLGERNGGFGDCPNVDPCPGVTTFFSHSANANRTFTRANVSADAKYRTIQIALAMQQAGIYVYCIGYGSNVDLPFLSQLANDPASSTYNANLPTGKALQAGTPQAIKDAFQVIAASVLERLTR